MTGLANEAGQVLGATTAITGAAMLANTGNGVISSVIFGLVILAAVAVVTSSAVRRLLVRK